MLCLKQFFLGTTQSGGTNYLVGHCLRLNPVAAGLQLTMLNATSSHCAVTEPTMTICIMPSLKLFYLEPSMNLAGTFHYVRSLLWAA